MQRFLKRPRQFFLLNLMIILWTFYIVRAFTVASNLRENIYLIVLLSIPIVLLLLSFFGRDNKYKKLLALLYHYCQPRAYLTEARNLLRLEEEKKKPKDKNKLLFFIANGLYAAGNFQEAMDIINSFDIFYHYKNAVFIANYFHRKFLISLELERQDIAWGSLVKMKEALMNIRKRKSLSLFTRVYMEDMHILNVVRGNYTGAEGIFKGMFDNGQSNYERSFASFLLGGVYAQLGNEEKAKYFYEYTVEYGNKLYIAGKAAEILGLKGWVA